MAFRIGPALAAAGGTLLLYSGLTGKNWSKALQSLITTGKPSTSTDYGLTSFTGGTNSSDGTSGNTNIPSAPADISGNVQLGQQLAGAYGWGSGQEWDALYNLWEKESGWNNLADNPSSGAYGIAQALPPTKYPPAAQASGGSSASAQIQWGLQYIQATYGDPIAAWAHEVEYNWY